MKKVMVWGKFDILHEGHLEFLKYARDLGDQLYVVVITDESVKENTGELPVRTAEERREWLVGLDIITDAYVDSFADGLLSVLRLRPDIFVFGHDQKTKWEEKLQEHLSCHGINPEYVRLGVYSNGVHSKDLKC